jgi:hypothetical protein
MVPNVRPVEEFALILLVVALLVAVAVLARQN